MLAGVVGELDDKQVAALHAATDAVGPGDLWTALLRGLQEVDHLSVGLIAELNGGVRLFSQREFHVVVSLHILLGWKRKPVTGHLFNPLSIKYNCCLHLSLLIAHFKSLECGVENKNCLGS